MFTELKQTQTMTAETLPLEMPDAEVLPLEERDPALPVEIGGLALGNEVVIDDDLELLNAVANGVDVRAEDAGRTHNIEAAHEAALLEEAHTQALIENEVFDAHAEALHENEIFDAHEAAIKEDEERSQKQQAITAELELQESKQQAMKELRAEDLQSQAIESDHRKQAEVALRDAGYMESLPLDAQIHKDLATGNLVVVGHDDVKIIESFPGGRTEITDYSYDEDQGTLTISSQGNSIVATRTGEFAQTDQGQWQQYADVIKLPPNVASLVGFDKVTPVPSRRAR
jgi:hypothetical protein